jgi:hypothetical protein
VQTVLVIRMSIAYESNKQSIRAVDMKRMSRIRNTYEHRKQFRSTPAIVSYHKPYSSSVTPPKNRGVTVVLQYRGQGDLLGDWFEGVEVDKLSLHCSIPRLATPSHLRIDGVLVVASLIAAILLRPVQRLSMRHHSIILLVHLGVAVFCRVELHFTVVDASTKRSIVCGEVGDCEGLEDGVSVMKPINHAVVVSARVFHDCFIASISLVKVGRTRVGNDHCNGIYRVLVLAHECCIYVHLRKVMPFDDAASRLIYLSVNLKIFRSHCS